MNTPVIKEFRANAGKVGGMFEGMDLLLLTTKGRKSGQPRVAPLAYSTDGDALVVAGSNGGRDTDPWWVANLDADPTATVELGTESFPAQVEIVRSGAERDRLYAAHAQKMPGFAGYERKTDRTIPVVKLTRRAG
jgi:deazaflavin-dependent oxidoreductase (nitroreductase family)